MAIMNPRPQPRKAPRPGAPGQMLPGAGPRPKQQPRPGQMLPGVRPVATRRPIQANSGTRSTRAPLNKAMGRPTNQLKPVTKRPVRKAM